MGSANGKPKEEAEVQRTQLMEMHASFVKVSMDAQAPLGGGAEEEHEEEEEAEEEGGEKVTEDGDGEVSYATYAPKKFKIPGMQPHPSLAVENGTLATAEPPAVTYELEIAKKMPAIVKQGRLSSLQLEFVAYACQRHEKFLKSGSRCGYFLGDGAGMGKGRQLAGLILENVLKGRRKHVWISTNIDLMEDAKRDVGDLCDDVDIVSLPSSKSARISEGRPDKKGVVLFTTYSSMSKGVTKTNDTGSRLEQIVEWVGENYEGCLLFDEAHRAKNLISETKGTETAAGMAVFNIQAILKLCRVVYCSATGVSEPRNYAYMVRLGLWGPESPFPTHDGDELNQEAIKNFISVVTSRGVGAMELCAVHLKMEGALCCRTLSYTGVDFNIVEAELTDEQRRVYDRAAQLWQLLHIRAEAKLSKFFLLNQDDATGEYKHMCREIHAMIWGGHQRFFRSLITSFKVPELVRIAREALDDGKCVVIGLQSTGESHSKRAVAKKQERDEASDDENKDASGGDSMLSAPQETLLYVVDRVWADEVDDLKESARAAKLKRKSPGATGAEDEVDDAELFSDDESFKASAKKKKKPLVDTANTAGNEEPDEERDSVPALTMTSRSPAGRAKQRKSTGSASQASSIEEFDLCSDDDDVEVVEASPRKGGVQPDVYDWGVDDENEADQDEAMDDAPSILDLMEDDTAWVEAFRKQVKALELPGNALDMIIDELGGFDAVAEMTGRTSRMVRNYKGEWIYEKRTANGVTMDEQNIYEREEFQDGRKLVAILSDAASSGVSLHAERRVKNQRRRCHITLELPWSADKTIQQMGRSHRSNQSVAPEYKLLVSPLGGERRFVAAVVKRLESLGALTQGDRRATGVTSSWGCFNVDTEEGEATVSDIMHHTGWEMKRLLGKEPKNPQLPLVKPPAISEFEKQQLAKLCIDNARILGLNSKFVDADALAQQMHLLHAANLWLSLVGLDADDLGNSDVNKGIVGKFLNRILGLEVARQQVMFDYFARYLEKTIKAAKRDGTYNQGIKNIEGRQITFVESQRRRLKIETPSALPIEVQAVKIDTGLDYESAKAKLDVVKADTPATQQQERRQRNSWTPVREAARFGDSDGFYYDDRDKSVCLIIESGEASIRSLSTETGKFTVFFPTRLRKEDQIFSYIKKNWPIAAVEPDQLVRAKAYWDRQFNNRNKNFMNYVLTGPVLYVWGSVLYVQCVLNTFARDIVRCVRVCEKKENGAVSGRSVLGILLDFERIGDIIAKLEIAADNTDEARIAGLQREHATLRDNKHNRRRDAAKKAARTRKENERASDNATPYLRF